MTNCDARKHDTETAYTYFACRCEKARHVTMRNRKLRRAGLLRPGYVPTTGSARRLQALAALGWTLGELGARLGLPQTRLTEIFNARQLRAVTARRIAALYDELSMTPGPSSLARGRARSKGWAPPLAWDDDTIDDPKAQPNNSAVPARATEADTSRVDRAASGERLHLNREEKQVVIRRLHAAGLNDQQIARRIGMSSRRVLGWRQRMGLPALTPGSHRAAS